jgi:hypothetical protein
LVGRVAAAEHSTRSLDERGRYGNGDDDLDLDPNLDPNLDPDLDLDPDPDPDRGPDGRTSTSVDRQSTVEHNASEAPHLDAPNLRAGGNLMVRCAPLVAAGIALAISFATPARADGVLPSVATPMQREQAQSRFRRGKELLDGKRYDEALAEFRASHEIVASPNTRLEIARCLRQNGKIIAAYAELGRAAVEAKELARDDNRYQRAADAAIAERAGLEPRLGFVSLTIQNPSEGTRVTVGDEEIRQAAWGEPAPVIAGTTEIGVETPGHAPIKRTVTLAAGEKSALTIDAQSGESIAEPSPPPPAEPPRPQPQPDRTSMRKWAYVAGGVGGVGLVTFAIFGSLARSTYDDLQTVCRGGACPANKADEISSGKTYQTVANVGLALGILGVASGATLFVLSLPKASPTQNAALVLSPRWIGVRGNL